MTNSPPPYVIEMIETRPIAGVPPTITNREDQQQNQMSYGDKRIPNLCTIYNNPQFKEPEASTIPLRESSNSDYELNTDPFELWKFFYSNRQPPHVYAKISITTDSGESETTRSSKIHFDRIIKSSWKRMTVGEIVKFKIQNGEYKKNVTIKTVLHRYVNSTSTLKEINFEKILVGVNWEKIREMLYVIGKEASPHGRVTINFGYERDQIKVSKFHPLLILRKLLVALVYLIGFACGILPVFYVPSFVEWMDFKTQDQYRHGLEMHFETVSSLEDIISSNKDRILSAWKDYIKDSISRPSDVYLEPIEAPVQS